MMSFELAVGAYCLGLPVEGVRIHWVPTLEEHLAKCIVHRMSLLDPPASVDQSEFLFQEGISYLLKELEGIVFEQQRGEGWAWLPFTHDDLGNGLRIKYVEVRGESSIEVFIQPNDNPIVFSYWTVQALDQIVELVKKECEDE